MANLLPTQIAARVWQLLHPEERVLANHMSVCRASASGASAAARPGFQALSGIFSLLPELQLAYLTGVASFSGSGGLVGFFRPKMRAAIIPSS